jgi:Ca-activated chloride channel family protein
VHRILRFLILAAVIGILLPAAFGADRVARFVRPRHLSTVVGATPFSLEIHPPGSARIREVRIKLDGEPLIALNSPPWEGSFEAGDGSTGHRLEAEIVLDDGSVHKALVRTTAIQINEVEDVDLVNLHAVVRDRKGNYITGLAREQFSLLEDGTPQTIRRFSTDLKPLAIGIVLDVSRTMRGEKLEAARNSALRFLDTLGEEDRAMVVTFSNRVQVLQPATSDRSLLADAIRSVEVEGGTALYDGIWRTADYLRRLDGRRVMLLLTDGRDEAGNGMEPGSLHTLEEALDHSNRNDVMIFAVGYGKKLKQLDFYQRHTLESILLRLAETSGGAVLFPKRIGSLKKSFEAVTRDLRHQYSIAYISTNEDRDGAWRTIELSTDVPRHEVVTRNGYFAPSGSSAPAP